MIGVVGADDLRLIAGAGAIIIAIAASAQQPIEKLAFIAVLPVPL